MKPIAGLLLLTALIGGPALAQPNLPPNGPPPAAARGPGAHHDPAEHLAALHDRLGITPAQSAAWDSYAKVLTGIAEQHRTNRQAGGRMRFLEMSTPERLAYLQQRRAAREQDRTALNAAAMALLPALNDTQKVRAYLMLPGLASLGLHGHDPGRRE